MEETHGISRKTIIATQFSEQTAQEVAAELESNLDVFQLELLEQEPSADAAATITKMSHYFASMIPDEVLTPAQINDFLKERLTCPCRAIKEVKAFVVEHDSALPLETDAEDVPAEPENVIAVAYTGYAAVPAIAFLMPVTPMAVVLLK